MAAEHILTIRIQFEDLPPDSEKEIKNAAKKVEDTLTEGYERAAISGGEAMIRGMSTLQEAWKEFDWSHPINSLKKLFGGLIEWFRNRLGIIGGIAIGIVGMLVAAFKKLMGPQAELVKTFSMLRSEMGATVGTGVEMGERVSKALQEIADVSIRTGMAMEDVTSSYTQLAQIRVPIGDLKEMTQVTILASKALGTNVAQMGDFIGGLKVMGRLSNTEVKGMIQNFSNVQDAIGLTEKEMSGLLETTTMLVMQLGVMGATAKDITAVSTATAQLTGMFGELGLGAEKGGELMSKLFDPSRISENAFLIRSMGFSMGEYMDMISGGPADQAKLTRGLVDAASVIQRMADSGAKSYQMNIRAQQLGFANFQTALRIAQEGAGILDNINKTAEGQVDWAQRAAEGQATLADAFGRFRNRFMAFFGKAVAPLIGKFTKIIAVLEKKWIDNEAAIGQFFDKMSTGLMKLIENFDPQKIVGWFEKIGNVIRWLGENMDKVIPIAIALGAAFLTFKFLPGIIKGVKALTGVFGGLTKGLGGLGKAAGGAKGATQGVSGMMKLLGKAAMGVALVLALAGAIWILSQALKTFTEDVSWGGMLKALVALVAITAVMVGLGALFATPFGMAIIGGIILFSAALVTLSLGMLLLGVAIKKFGDAADSIKMLGEVASEDLAKKLIIVGQAVNEFVKQFGLLQLLKAPLLIALGAAIKKFAIGMWVLGEIKDIDSASSAMLQLGETIKTLSEGRFKNNAKVIADTTRSMADSLKILSGIREEDFDRLGPAMESVATGFNKWMQAVSPSGAGAVIESLLTRWGAVSKAFKDMAIAIWVLGETKGAFDDIATGMDTMSESLPKFFESMSAIGGLMDKEGRGLTRFGDFMAMLQGIKPIDFAPMLKGLKGFPDWISEMAPALEKLGKGISIADSKILRGVNRVERLMKTAAETGVGVKMDVETGNLTAEMTGAGAIANSVKVAIGAQTEILIEKLEELFDNEWRSAVLDTASVLTAVHSGRKLRVQS